MNARRIKWSTVVIALVVIFVAWTLLSVLFGLTGSSHVSTGVVHFKP